MLSILDILFDTIVWKGHAFLHFYFKNVNQLSSFNWKIFWEFNMENIFTSFPALIIF